MPLARDCQTRLRFSVIINTKRISSFCCDLRKQEGRGILLRYFMHWIIARWSEGLVLPNSNVRTIVNYCFLNDRFHLVPVPHPIQELFFFFLAWKRKKHKDTVSKTFHILFVLCVLVCTINWKICHQYRAQSSKYKHFCSLGQT